MRPRRRVERWRQAEWLSLEDAAGVLGCHTGHAYRLADAGRLSTVTTTDGPRRVQRVVRTVDLVAYLEALDGGQMTLFGEPAPDDAPDAPTAPVAPADPAAAARGAAAARRALHAARSRL